MTTLDPRAHATVTIPRDLVEQVVQIANRNERSLSGDRLAAILSAPADLPYNRENWTWEPLYASPQPTNTAQVAELIEEAKDFAERMTGQPWACELVEKLIDALTAAIGAGGQAVASLDDVAARMWKADAEDSGTPASVAAGRTREAFDVQAEELKARWRKFAKAASSALSKPHPADERVVEAQATADQIIGQIEERFPNWRSYRDLIDCIDCTLSAKEGR